MNQTQKWTENKLPGNGSDRPQPQSTMLILKKISQQIIHRSGKP